MSNTKKPEKKLEDLQTVLQLALIEGLTNLGVKSLFHQFAPLKK